MANSDNIRVEADNLHARAVPGDVAEALLASELTCTVSAFVPGGPLGYQRLSRPKRLYRRDADLAASRLKDLDADVLIVAGPEWPLELDGFPPRGPGPARQALLVDAADDCDGIARAAVRRRLHAYAARGRPSVGIPAWARQDGDETASRCGRGRTGGGA